jgi:F-type H+-transporting ATPase subunit a
VAAAGKIDPMHQFTIAPLGSDQLAATPFQFTNSALWMLVVLVVIVAFMWGGLKRELVPGRWQAAVEYLTGFLDNVTTQSIGPQGRKYLPWIFTAFTFILAANWVGAMPFGIVPAAHPFTVTSQFTVTGTMSIISFAIVLGVGFYKHGLKFLTLFLPHGTPKPLLPIIFVVELISFLVRPFSLGLRPFIAMFAGHILLEVFGSFVVEGLNSGTVVGYGVTALAFLFVVFVNALELLVGAIQAFVFALLTALYINDAVNLH